MSPERPVMTSMPARAGALAGVRIGLLERPHLPGHQGSAYRVSAILRSWASQ